MDQLSICYTFWLEWPSGAADASFGPATVELDSAILSGEAAECC